MKLTVKSVSKLKGKVRLPASKSYSIRAFMIAACGGQSVIKHSSNCDDALVSMRVAQQLGAKIKASAQRSYNVDARVQKAAASVIRVRESGTVLRFVLPLLALHEKSFQVVGQGTLVGRPNTFLNQALRKMGVDIKGQGTKESVPIHVRGGKLKGGEVSIDGSLSSQFISALLITAPRLSQDLNLTLTGKKLVSTDYITMTLQVLKKAGIDIQKQSPRSYKVKAGQKFKGLKNFTVPSDYGLAAFLLAAGALVDSNIKLDGHLKDDLVQADGHIVPLLRKMGVRFQKTNTSIHIKGPFNLKGGQFSLKDCPDLVPIMSVLALFAKGKTRLYNIQHARAKESDRISDLRKELLKIGADVRETKNELIIVPQPCYKENVELDPHKDHRLAMSFAVLGLKLGVTIKDIECTHKSYPDFVRDFRTIGARVSKSKI
ncbi:MAG: 3-phosphoshikimate 1-carboxyvinyltransferase [Candidatus Omnitrophica bacterium]|nr:3-phosphoshikimate 1-carboxyvinyltransferase [Candidatus Omnitrophota bacterium]